MTGPLRILRNPDGRRVLSEWLHSHEVGEDVADLLWAVLARTEVPGGITLTATGDTLTIRVDRYLSLASTIGVAWREACAAGVRQVDDSTLTVPRPRHTP